MKYSLTALTPMLVGDGQKLSPIDYMVWKEQINVLDQKRIFKLLAKGPRLEGYLTQLRTADKLDFASWGGFAQNYAERRIAFEHPTATAQWNQSRTEHLISPPSVPLAGPYLPATAIKVHSHRVRISAGLPTRSVTLPRTWTSGPSGAQAKPRSKYDCRFWK
ncbi:MAG: hypothetical protein WKF37_05215 [Bryobacteraceae bacterium]